MPSASPAIGWKSGGNRTSRSGGRPATDTGRPRGREHHHRLDQSASAGRSSGAHHRHHLRHPAVTPSTDLDNYPLDSSGDLMPTAQLEFELDQGRCRAVGACGLADSLVSRRRRRAFFRRARPEAMALAPGVRRPSLPPATPVRLLPPQPPLHAGLVRELCSTEGRGRPRSTRCPRHSSRPGWDTQSRLILQLQIVPAHQRSDLAHLVGLGLASYLLESKKLVYAGPPELGLSRLVDRRLPAGSAAGFGPHGTLTAAMASTGARVVAIRPDRPPNWGHFMVAHRTRGIG